MKIILYYIPICNASGYLRSKSPRPLIPLPIAHKKNTMTTHAPTYTVKQNLLCALAPYVPTKPNGIIPPPIKKHKNPKPTFSVCI